MNNLTDVSTEQLKRRYFVAEERQTRAMSNVAWCQDELTLTRIAAELEKRGLEYPYGK